MFSVSKERAARRLAKQEKREQLLQAYDKIKKDHPEWITGELNQFEKNLQKSVKTAEIDAMAAQFSSIQESILTKIKATELAQKNQEKLALEKKFAYEKQRLDQRIKELIYECSDTPASHVIRDIANDFLPLHPRDPFVADPNFRRYDLLNQQWEVRGNAMIALISHLASLAEEKQIVEQITLFHDEEKEIADKMTQLNDVIKQQKQFVKQLADLEEYTVAHLFTHPNQSQWIENDRLVCGPDGTYTNGNNAAPALHENKYDVPVVGLNAPRDIVVTAIYNVAKEQRIRILKQIADLPIAKEDNVGENQKKIIDAIDGIKISVNQLAELDKKRKEFITSRNALTAKLCLDKNNIAHLKFWANEADSCFHGFGGKEISIIDENNQVQTFRVPTRVFKMMGIIDRDYPNAESFERDFTQARTTKPSFFSNPLSFWTRSQLTQLVYNAQKIDEFPALEPDEKQVAFKH
jgi:hypothetical protein